MTLFEARKDNMAFFIQESQIDLYASVGYSIYKYEPFLYISAAEEKQEENDDRES